MKYKILIAFILFSPGLFAQNKLAKQLFKKYIGVCNAYKQLPLHLEIEYKKTSNMALYNDDSTTMQGVFYIQKKGAYIQFGQAEQIITDSLVLIVMGNIKQMVLSKNNINIAGQVNKMISAPVSDSSIKILIDKYTIQQKILNKETAVLTITNKQNVYSTQLPLEINTLTYNTKNGNPVNIETLKRSLVKKPEEGGLPFSATVVSIPQKGDYLIKEELTVYRYKTLTHDENIKLPVLLADRIEKDDAANYAPVKGYKNYALIMN